MPLQWNPNRRHFQTLCCSCTYKAMGEATEKVLELRRTRKAITNSALSTENRAQCAVEGGTEAWSPICVHPLIALQLKASSLQTALVILSMSQPVQLTKASDDLELRIPWFKSGLWNLTIFQPNQPNIRLILIVLPLAPSTFQRKTFVHMSTLVYVCLYLLVPINSLQDLLWLKED